MCRILNTTFNIYQLCESGEIFFNSLVLFPNFLAKGINTHTYTHIPWSIWGCILIDMVIYTDTINNVHIHIHTQISGVLYIYNIYIFIFIYIIFEFILILHHSSLCSWLIFPFFHTSYHYLRNTKLSVRAPVF